MKKVFLLSIVLNFACNYIVAQQQVSMKEAKNAAIHTFYSKSNILKISDRAKTDVEIIYSFSNGKGDTLMYEVVFRNGLAILLSGSKACLPVLGYYTKKDNNSILDTNNENIPCGLKFLLKEYAREIDICFTQKTMKLDYAVQWQELQEISSSKINKSTSIVVNPLLTTKWGQSRSHDGCCDAYNYCMTEVHKKCTSCTSGKCSVGCTATAMAQIMKRWNYPVYQLNRVVQFDWCNMPDSLLCHNNPKYETERNAIAHLMKDCADAANTTYCNGGCSSTSTVYKARQAFVNDLGYSSDADHQWKSSYNINTWKGRIKNNLNQGWPVLYGGYDPSPPAGHAFVLDGYNSDDCFHVNWGWRGSEDNYFTLDNLTLDSSTFSTQSACFYIYPDVNQDYCNFTLPLSLHYAYWSGELGFPASLVHLTVPKTATVLRSVPAGSTIPTSWHTIQSGEVAVYTAHERISLQPGFKVEAGARFTARIEPCADCGSRAGSTLLSSQDGDVNGFNDFSNNDTTRQKSFKNTLQEAGDREKNKNKEVSLYPNPNNGTFTVSINFDPQEIITVHVYNSLGFSVYQQTGLAGNTIQLPSTANGLFYVEIVTATQKFVRKIAVL